MIDIDQRIEELEDRGISSDCGNQDSGLPRVPSFSGWCDEDGKGDLKHPVVNSSAVEDFDFDWPFIPHGQSEDGILSKYRYQYSKSQMENMHQAHVGNDMDRSTALEEGNNNNKYVPFEVENGSIRERSFPLTGSHESDSLENYKGSAQNSESPISAANVLKTLFFILMWYTFSTFLTLYNKTLLGDDLGKFPAPLLMNTVHFAMQAIMSKTIIWLRSDKSQTGATMSWKDYSVRVVPTALATAMDINLSNESLVVISVTFATMCKSAAPIFLLLFAFGFRLETPSLKLLGIILVISVGILLTVAKETEFDFLGFILVMLAAVMSGFRWCMTQILLQKEAYGLKDPITLMSFMTPVMAIATFLLSLLLDPWHEFKKNSYFNNSWHVMRSCLLMFLGGTLAFFMVLTEYILVSVTSAVTVTIAGVVKEAVTIMVAVFYFHDEFTWLKGVGLLIIMFGVSLFNWYKYQKLQKGHCTDSKIEELPATNAAAKYVILEETDDQDNEI